MPDDLDPTLNEQWARIRGRLRKDVGDAAFRSWLKPLSFQSMHRGVIRLAVPTRLMRDWIKSNYAEQISGLWREEEESVAQVEIVVQPPNRAPRLTPQESTSPGGTPARERVGDQDAPHRREQAKKFDPAYHDVGALP